LNWQKSIEEQGFALIPRVLGDEILGMLLNELLRDDLSKTRAGIRHAMRFAVVNTLAHDEPLSGIARKILGDKAVPFRATLFDKSATANWLVVWHQDTALPLKERRETPGWGPWSIKEGVQYAHAPAKALQRVLALRVHLDDSTSKNGPLRILPGTHNSGVLTDDAIHDLWHRLTPVDCPVAKGGVLAMRPLVVHASSKSQSANPRRVLHIEYAASQLIGDGLELAVA
jgi:ectoine hydroxylase-related dioxygenase (phytanoyl-CoA dioxygenase family)